MQLFKHSSLEFKTSQAKSHRRNALQMWSVPLSNGVRTKCQRKVGILSRLLLWLAFCPSQFLVGILSGPSQHVLAFCQNHEKCRHLSECEWSFVRSVDFLPYRQKANLAKSQSLMTLVGHSYEAHFHNSKCSEDDIRWSERFSYVLRRFHYILIVLRLFSQKKAPKSPWVLKIWCRLFVAISKVCKDQSFYRVSKKSEFYRIEHLLIGFPPCNRQYVSIYKFFCSFLTRTKREQDFPSHANGEIRPHGI